MSCIRYKFKSALEYDKVTFDGLQLSVSDLREKIMALKKMSVNDNLTLDIMDAQTKKIYTDDSTMIPRNSTVIIIRVPKLTQSKLPGITPQTKDSNSLQEDTMLSAEQLRKTADLAGANASEEDKVRAMMSQAGEDYNPLNYARFKTKGAVPGLKPPPPNYICHRCNQKGHWIKFCPTNGDPAFDNMRLKRSSGIPNSHVAIASSTSVPGAMLDRYGNVVVRTVDLIAADGSSKRKNAPVAEPEVEKLPPELTCSICKELVRDAVIIPCCAESFCDECIRVYLLENDFTCYSCKVADVSPEALVPNKSLRAAAKKFQSRQTEKRSIALARGLPATAIAIKEIPSAPTATVTVPTPLPPPVSNSSSSQDSSDSTVMAMTTDSQKPSDESQIDHEMENTNSENTTKNEGTIGKDSSSPLPSQERTPSPFVNKSTAESSVTEPTATTTTSITNTQVSPPKALITAPIVIQPPVPRFSNIHQSQPPLLLPAGFPLPAVRPPQLRPPAALNPFLAPPPQPGSDPAVMRLSEFLAATERHDNRNSPPPLSAEEFYLQQKMFRNIAGGSRSRTGSFSSRTPSPYSSGSYSSRTPSPAAARGRSRSPYPPPPHGSKSKSHRHHHRHRSLERMKRKRKETDKSQHKHKHKKKKRKHSQSTAAADEASTVLLQENAEVNGTDVIDQSKPPCTEEESIDIQDPLPSAKPSSPALLSAEVENGSAPVCPKEEASLPLVPAATVAADHVSGSDMKIKKKKRHKDSSKSRDIALHSTLTVTRTKHHKHRRTEDSRHHSNKSKKKLKKSSHE